MEAVAGDDGRGNIPLLAGTALAVMLFRIAYEQTGNTFAIWAEASVDKHASFLMMAAICVVSGLLLLAIHRVHQAQYGAVAAPAEAVLRD